MTSLKQNEALDPKTAVQLVENLSSLSPSQDPTDRSSLSSSVGVPCTPEALQQMLAEAEFFFKSATE